MPANNLARRHPFVLNSRIAPKHWSDKAMRKTLPHYDWKAVMEDLQRDVAWVETTHIPAESASAASGAKEPMPTEDWGF